MAYNAPHFHLSVPAPPPGATGVWWVCDTAPDSPPAELAAGSGELDTDCQPEADEPWDGRIAWGTVDGPLSDPGPAHEAHA